MTVLLNITTVPQDFAAGSFNTAATAINGGKWRITITPTAASSTYTGGNFHSILGQPHGGLWLNDASLELYVTPDDNIAASFTLVWLANQPFTLDVDARPGHLTATVSGATSGNGTVSLSFPGPYIDGSLLLEVGRQNGGANFQFVGTISPIDDGISSDTVTAAAVTIAGGTVNDQISFKDTSTPATAALAGQNISEGRGGNSDDVTAATVTVSGQTVSEKRTTADFISSAHADIAGGNVLESLGGGVSLGPTAIDFQRFGSANRPSSIVLDTPASGAVVLLCAGGKSGDVSTPWTDSKNATAPVTIGALVEYSDFTGYGTIIAMTPAPMTGGTGQAFTQPVTTNDEDTTFGLVAVVTGGHPRVTEVHNNVANASGGTTQTSPSITIDGEALLVAYWWGASPVVPPFSTPSPGVGTPYTAVPNNGYTVAQSYLVNNEFGEVQAAMAYLYVPAGAGPSSRNVTWAHSPAQGAQLRLVAIQPALADAIEPATADVFGQPIGERVAYKVTVVAASLAIIGGTITEGLVRMDNIAPASLALTSESVLDRRAFAAAITAATAAISGGVVQDQIAHNQNDVVGAAAAALAGDVVTDRVAVIDVVIPATMLAAGGTIQDAVSSGAQDLVLPAFLTIAGVLVGTRVTRGVTIVPAAGSLRGADVQFQISTPVPEGTPPIPPGRAEAQLVGHVVVPSIESRESQLSHLYGVVRSKDV